MSKELEIFEFDGKTVVDSRDVAEWVGKNHKDLMRDIRGYVACMEGEREVAPTNFFIESTYTSQQNKVLPCYLITRKGCDMVANKMIGTKGVLFSAMYIERFHEYEEQLRANRKPDSYMIEDSIERARRWIEEQEERAALAAKVDEQQAQLEEQKPQVDFARHVSDASDLLTIAEFAKIVQDEDIKIGRNKLFDWLRENEYIRPGSREPYQRYVDQELFRVKETVKHHAYGYNVFPQTFITGKGQIYFVEKLRSQFKANQDQHIQ